MIHFSDSNAPSLTGPAGSLLVGPDDEITLKLAMLFEGEGEGLGPLRAAAKFGYSKTRYFQLRHLFEQRGALALLSQTTGPQLTPKPRPRPSLPSARRQMCRRPPNAGDKPIKMAQTFFLLDAQAIQPICFTIGSGSCRATQAASQLLDLAQPILGLDPNTPERPLVLADEEPYAADFLVQAKTRPFDLLVPMKSTQRQQKRWQALAPENFQRHWAGYATCKQSYDFGPEFQGCFEIVQRSGERPEIYPSRHPAPAPLAFNKQSNELLQKKVCQGEGIARVAVDTSMTRVSSQRGDDSPSPVGRGPG